MTLLELLLVVGIMSIILAVTIPLASNLGEVERLRGWCRELQVLHQNAARRAREEQVTWALSRYEDGLVIHPMESDLGDEDSHGGSWQPEEDIEWNYEVWYSHGWHEAPEKTRVVYLPNGLSTPLRMFMKTARSQAEQEYGLLGAVLLSERLE